LERAVLAVFLLPAIVQTELTLVQQPLPHFLSLEQLSAVPEVAEIVPLVEPLVLVFHVLFL
jgi:hypothetical protein